MKKKKKILLLLALLSLTVCILSTAYTYAKYFSNENNRLGSNIKKWHIKVNNEDISTTKTFTNKININFSKTEHKAANTIAPGATGSFTIDIDYTNTEVNFDYYIEVLPNENLPDIKIGQITPTYSTITEDTDGIKKGRIDVSNENKIETLTVTVEWLEGTGEQMDNFTDTSIPINNDPVSFDIKLKLVQSAN